METFLITGANHGLGFEFVRNLAARPDTFTVAAIHTTASDDLLKLKSEYPDHILIVRMDVGNQDSILTAAQKVSQNISQLDVLINNAAIHPPVDQQTLEAATREQVMDVFEMNAVGPLLIVQAFLELLKKSSHPRILNISSERGSMAWQAGRGGYYSYSLSKAGLNMLTRLLAVDLQPFNITTVTVHPGWMRTKMGGANATLSPAESARGILELADHLTLEQNGGFYKWNGEVHPW